jgi:dihydroorotate dehydrogenase electron transfer subunit
MKKLEDLKVIKNEKLNKNHFLLELQSETKLPEIFPGQFAEVEILKSKNTFLRRPLSIHDVDYNKNTITFFVRIAGEGTEKLSEYGICDSVSVVYPLGKGFNHTDEKNALLIGGGCGVAPLLYFAKIIKAKGITPDILMGGRTKNDILRYEEYTKYGNVHVTTEDDSFVSYSEKTDSCGEKGYVTNHSILQKKKFDKIYVCGPEGMMKAVGKFAYENKIECEVSLENMMACGIGACLCCITDTKKGRKCVCTEGPVFNIKNLEWF